jgi:hypothetical protein
MDHEDSSPTRERQPAHAALVALLETLMERSGLTFVALSERTLYDRAQIQRAFHSKVFKMSTGLAEALDKVFGTAPRIVAARNTAYLEHVEARSARTTAAPAPGPVGNGDDVDASRREALAAFAASAGALTLRIGTSRTGPGRKDLYAAQRTVAGLAARYPVTPHGDLLGDIAEQWHTVEDLLADGWRSDRYREGFQLVAGQLTYLLSRLAFNMGEYGHTAEFLGLVEQHADAAGDPSLHSACATMWSSIFFYEGNYPEAERAAREGLRHRYPYDTARLHSYAARALAALGDPAALDELDHMDNTIWPDATPEAGAEPFLVEDGLGMRAISLARLGRIDEALPLVDASLAGYTRLANPSFEAVANTHLVRGWALKGADPAEAAASVNRGLAIVDGRPTHTVTHRAVEIASALREHRRAAPVAELFDRLAAVRRAPRELTA